MTRGFVILAQNTQDVNYVRCAEVLASSIHTTMPNAKVSIITTDIVDHTLFDKVILLPYGDLAPNNSWKLINDWQVYEASPYDQTIKLEADMVIPRSIEHWWDILSINDVVVANTIRNFKGIISDCRVYRKLIDDNNLPDCYNAITYFKKAPIAKEFFDIVRNVFDNWTEYKTILKCNVDEEVTTDWAYAIACHVLGKEKTMLPNFTDMSMVHMKQYVNELSTDNWTDTLIYECLPDVIRINSYIQSYPLHYHIKSFCDKISKGQ